MSHFTRLLSTFSALSFVCSTLSAQITLGPAWLLKAGYSATLNSQAPYADPAGNIGKAGANQTWNFTNLRTDDTTFVTVRDARSGSAADSFPSATLVFISTLDLGLASAGSEVYLQRKGGTLEIVGIADSDPNAFFPVFRLNDPLTFQTTPLTYRSSGTDKTRARFNLPKQLLTLLTGDSTAARFIDSLRLSIGQDVSYEVDGWGTVSLLGRSRDALRLRTVTEAAQDFEIKIPFLGWVPISRLIQLPDSLLDAGATRSIDYSWLVAEEPYPLVRVTADTLGRPLNISYIRSSLVGLRDQEAAKVQLSARYESGVVELNYLSELKGMARVEAYGTDGRLLDRAAIDLGTGQFTFDAQTWPSGIHLISIWQERQLLGTVKVGKF